MGLGQSQGSSGVGLPPFLVPRLLIFPSTLSSAQFTLAKMATILLHLKDQPRTGGVAGGACKASALQV
jgi:hypothetical protein